MCSGVAENSPREQIYGSGGILLWKKVLLNTDTRPIVLASSWVMSGHLFFHILLNFIAPRPTVTLLLAA